MNLLIIIKSPSTGNFTPQHLSGQSGTPFLNSRTMYPSRPSGIVCPWSYIIVGQSWLYGIVYQSAPARRQHSLKPEIPSSRKMTFLSEPQNLQDTDMQNITPIDLASQESEDTIHSF